jgi:Zn-dependent M16 (insulinase) family peptidase
MISLLIPTLIILMDCSPLSQIQENATTRVEDVLVSCDKPICKHWELVTNVTIEDTLPVYKFRSKRTGIIIVLAVAESPIVNGYFCLSTEAFNNDGLPHTLEHLIFLGSEDYPYKEILDLMANRCLADRTNAWTDTDHTCYTVYTAGKRI